MKNYYLCLTHNSKTTNKLTTPYVIKSFFLVLLGYVAHTQVPLEKMPTPPTSSARLFYVQRSSNTNTIVYDANVLGNRKINPKTPLNIYWIRYAEKSQKEPLSYIQRNMAYGLDTSPIANESGSYEGKIVSYKQRRLKIMTDANGSPVALTTINGKIGQLQKVYVMIEETGKLIPKVLYIDLFGKDPKTGAEVYERFRP